MADYFWEVRIIATSSNNKVILRIKVENRRRIGFGGDLHKRAKDIGTILGYVRCTEAVQQSLMRDVIMRKQLTDFCSLGDWYDKGYGSDVPNALADNDLDIQLYNLLRGNLFGVIGNHIRLNMDSNPELHLIQPHPVLKSRRVVLRTHQIIRTPDIILFETEEGLIQISFMHYNMHYKNVLQYTPERLDNVTFHIALFHTPWIIPNQQLSKTTMKYNVNNMSNIGSALRSVDVAICGDIHFALGSFKLEHNWGETTVIVPGSFTNTDSSIKSRHHSILMPIITIESDSKYPKIEFTDFDLKTNLLTFKSTDRKAAENKLINPRSKKALTELVSSPTEAAVALGSGADNLETFMRANGFTDVDRRLIVNVLTKPDQLKELVDIYYSDIVEM